MCQIDWQATAAWAQALLTVAAVVWAARLQDRQLRKRDAAELRRRLDALGGLLTAARDAIVTARDGLLKVSVQEVQSPESEWALNEAYYMPVDTIRLLIQALGEVRLHELPSWPLAEATLTVRNSLTGVKGETELILRIVKDMGELEPDPFRDKLAEADAAIGAFELERDRLLAAAR